MRLGLGARILIAGGIVVLFLVVEFVLVLRQFQHVRTLTRSEQRAEQSVVTDRFGGSRSAYRAALAGARMTGALARVALADELRRLAVGATLRVAAPTAGEQRAWVETYGATPARLVHAARQC